LGKPAIQYCLGLLSHTSLRFQYRLANLAAFVLHRTPNQLSTQIRQNIRLCFKDLPKSEQQRIGRESMRHTCYSAVEPAALWFWPLDKVLGQITSFDICAEFEQHTGGKIILVPHLGSWDRWADSSTVAATLTQGVSYEVRVTDAPNMSYLDHHTGYQGTSGGGASVYNNVNIAELKVLHRH
jgi:lauroyl/myristoyl acyltransferase